MSTILRAPSAAQSFDKSYRAWGRPWGRAWGLDIVLKRLWAAYRRRRAEQAAIARLNAMTDRQLRDIGISRSQIEFAVKGDPERDRIAGRGF